MIGRLARSVPAALAMLASVLLLALSTRAHATAIPFGSMQPGFGIKPKDFALVRSGDTYHLFFIRDLQTPCGQSGPSEVELGHQTSTDLYTWTPQPPVLTAGTNGFTHDQVWAPSIYKIGSTWYMFYTHVMNFNLTQAIRVASSTDLFNWSPVTNFSEFDCVDIPWGYCNAGESQGAVVRDAGIYPDYLTPTATSPFRLEAFYTTKPSYQGILNCTGQVLTPGTTYMLGRSEMSLVPPTAFGTPIQLCYTHKLWANGDNMTTLESPALLRGPMVGTSRLWYMGYGAGGAFADSEFIRVGYQSPYGETMADVTFQRRGRLLRMSPYASDPANGLTYFFQDRYGNQTPFSDYQNWFAPEFFEDTDGRKYFATVHDVGCFSRIEIYQMRWPDSGQPEKFTLDQPIQFTSLAWNRTSINQSQAARLAIAAKNGTADEVGNKTCDIEVFASQPAPGNWQAVDPSSVGLPSSIALGGDQTYVWYYGDVPPGFDPNTIFYVYIRSKRSPAIATDNLAVIPVTDGCPPDHWPPCFPETAGGSIQAVPERDELRLLANGPRPRMELRLSRNETARVDIRDVQGRSVRRLREEQLAAGVYPIEWDGLSDSGDRTSRGVYFVTLYTGNARSTVKVIVIP